MSIPELRHVPPMLEKHGPPLISWHALQNSLLLRMGGAVAAVAMLAIVGMSVSGLVAESTQGGGEAINRSGSLRMQSWYMANLYLATPADGAGKMADALREFEATLADPTILTMLPPANTTELTVIWHGMLQEWRQGIRPRFLDVAQGRPVPLDAAARMALLDETRRFVGQIDRLVKQLENMTEAKIRVMRMVLGGTLALTLLVVLLTIWLIHTQLVSPLKRLLDLSRHVGRGDLTVRTPYTGEDELGLLGRAFNSMAEDLSKLYRDLEGRVKQKTAELTRSNQSLELLYHSIARLHGAIPDSKTYREVLCDIEVLLGLGHGTLCLGEQGEQDRRVVASTMQPNDADPCATMDCLRCHVVNHTSIRITENFHRHLTLPLSDAEHQYGVLILEIPLGVEIETWQVQLLEALSRHIGVAIGAERRIEQNRRLALLEERAVIARELHDSLAQSLAYMKIQVSRLKSAMKAGQPTEEVMEELRDGLNGAYQQLRELLATFRLRMDGNNLHSALEQTVAEFAQRGEIEISLDMSTSLCPLSPNEEIHILQIVREALSNVLHHARAKRARVGLNCLAEGSVQLLVEDDGEGIVKPADPHHYGMTIMEERTRSLNGELTFEALPQNGTRVALVFTPRRVQSQTAQLSGLQPSRA